MMKTLLRPMGMLVALAVSLTGVACTTTAPTNTNTSTNTNSAPAPAPAASSGANVQPVTLPVLDAFFADEGFAGELKSKLQLTDEQVNKLKTTAREETAKLRENDDGTTSAAREQAQRHVVPIIGEEKARQLYAFVNERWGSNGAATTATAATPSAVPSDTRIVVNAPAFRMDVFEGGKLVKTYKVGIGYPEFPLPTGQRKADTIIFNPTWTPPDEPWVEAPGSKVKPGETVKAGDKLNPLGPIKIPIGLPSLIHGGKSPARIGNFASHGCVGLTNDQVIEFAKMLSKMGGSEVTSEKVAEYQKDKSETKTVKLSNPVPVELRYETITVEDGKLHVYRDVYDRDTNTEENLRTVLQAYGVTMDQLSESERAQVTEALKQMSRDASGRLDPQSSNANRGNSNSPGNSNVSSQSQARNKKNDNSSGRVTRTIKGEKEMVIEIAALKGKGYPAPVDLNTGGAKPAAPAGKKAAAPKKSR